MRLTLTKRRDKMSISDITKHNWSDNCLNVDETETTNEIIRFDNNMYMVDIYRRDAIAIAKHFKIKAEEIK
jgi:hypothetical protein